MQQALRRVVCPKVCNLPSVLSALVRVSAHGSADSGKASEQYTAAIGFLRKKAAVTSVQGTTLGVYIDMQTKYAAAQVELEKVLTTNSGRLISNIHKQYRH